MPLLKVELLKLYKRKSVKVLLGVYALVLMILSAFYVFGEGSLGLTLYTEGQFLTGSLGVVMLVILPFLALYISSASFALEMSQGTYKNMLLMPISKVELYVSKLLAVMSLISGILVFQFAYSLLISLLLDGGFSSLLLLTAIGEYLGALIILGIIASAGALLSMWIRSTGLSVFVAYLSYIGLGILTLYFPVLKTISLSKIMGQYNHLFSSGFAIQLLSVFAYYILIMMVGLLIFDKKEDDTCLYE